MYTCIHVYIYIYIYTYRCVYRLHKRLTTANLRTKILDFRGFDSSKILRLSGGIPRPLGSFLEIMSQTNLSRDSLSREIGRMMVGALLLNKTLFSDYQGFVTDKAPTNVDECVQSLLRISIRRLSNGGSQIPEPLLISTSECP